MRGPRSANGRLTRPITRNTIGDDTVDGRWIGRRIRLQAPQIEAAPATMTNPERPGLEAAGDDCDDTMRQDSDGEAFRHAGKGTQREALLRRFHAVRPGVTSATLRRGAADPGGDGYDRLVAAVPPGARVLDLACGDRVLVSRLGPRAIGIDLAPSIEPGSGGAPLVLG